jgi:hypothetical protein
MLGGSKHVFWQMCKYVQIQIKFLRFIVGGLIGRSHVTFLTDFPGNHIAVVAKQHSAAGRTRLYYCRTGTTTAASARLLTQLQ